MSLVAAIHDVQLSSPDDPLGLGSRPGAGGPAIPSPPPSPELPAKSNALFEAAITGNLRGFLDALSDPTVDVNILDGSKSRRNVLFCALVGTSIEHPCPCTPERVAILKALVARPELSLYVLNTPIPSANGLTPLALACSIGTVEQALALLECPSVLVDARDARGATPLMYAARKGRVEIVQHLVLRGARPDLQDLKLKSAIEHAKRHANVLWQLENQLRRQRKSKFTSPSESRSPKSFQSLLPVVPETAVPSPSLFTSDLIQETSERLLVAIFNDDVSMLQAVLNNAASVSSLSPLPGPAVSRRKRVSVVEPPQPTLILNCLDANGYAPLHHAVMCRPPSIAVVEALYFAGADVNLRTAQGRSPLHVLAQYATGADEDEFVIRDFVLNFVHQFKASFACVDARGESSLHVAAERGASPFVLAGLLLCDEEGRMRELKNARGLRPIDVVKSEYRHVFGLLDPRPDSVCTLRPLVHVLTSTTPIPTLRPQQSFASISTVNSETTFHTDSSPERNTDALIVYDGDSVTADEASQAARQLLEDLEFTSIQRHLFFKRPGASPIRFRCPPNPSTHDLSTTPTVASLAFPPTPPTTPPCDNAVIELQRLTAQVTAYWRSCLGRLQEELNRTHQTVEKSHRTLGKLKGEVDKRHREGDRENMSAIALWASQEKPATREQSRHRSFTAPSSTAPPRFMDTVGEEGDGEAFAASWQPRGYLTDAGENGGRLLSSLPSTPVTANSVSSFFEKEEDAHELALLKKTRRLTSLLKAKLLPHTKRGYGQGQYDEPPVGARASYLTTLASTSSAILTPTEEQSAPHSTEGEFPPSRHAIDIGSPVTGSPVPTSWSRSASYSAPASGQQTPRGALRKAPVVFSRVTAELGRIGEYMRGIYALLDALDGDLVRAQELIELTIAPCTSPHAHPTDGDIETVEEAADVERIKSLRELFLGGLESRVTYALTGLDEVHKWNGLIRSLLRDFKRKLEGGLEDDHDAF